MAAGAWSFAGMGDLDGDERSDVIFKNEASGTPQAWFMNGGQVSNTIEIE